MRSMTDNWIINSFIPGAVLNSRTGLEMARIFVFTHLAGPLIAQPMGIFLYVVSPEVTPQLAIMVAGINAFLLLPIVLKMTGSMQLATLLSFQGLTALSLFGTYFYGGFTSPFLPWLIISLLLGLFYLSKRLKLVLGLFGANLGVFLACVWQLGLPNDIAAQDLRALVWLSITAATVYMTWMALYYARVMALRSELQTEADRYRHTVLELERTREIAERANRNRSVFFAKMSHELRTPLNVIIGYSEILLEDCADQPGGSGQKAQDLARINSAGKHLLALVSEVLDTESVEKNVQAVEITEFMLGELCDDVVANAYPIVNNNSSRLVVNCPVRAEMLRTDRTKVAQILINLLGNAGKFTKSGTVTLTLHVEKSIADDRLIASVSDTGIGIAPEALSKLFENYIQADATISSRFGGTGMGLAITRKFCSLLGGEIDVKSKLGEGSTFTVDIPARLGAKANSEEANEVVAPGLPKVAA
jgi:signal transduction histidine kinase